VKKTLPFIILLALLMSGCIEIVETITIHKNHSGNIRYSLETGKFSSFFSGFTEYAGSSLQETLENQTAIFKEKLGQMKGIDSIEYTFNTAANEYFLKFSFTNVKDLNNAFYSISNNRKGFFSPDFMKISRHYVVRKNFVPLLNKYIEAQRFDSSYIDFAEFVNFKTIIQMPSQLKGVKGDHCRIAEDQVSVVQTNKVNSIIDNSANLGIRIRY
jgi:hypothetical protein